MHQADKLLSEDFQKIIEDLISCLPEDRQIMLFSATFPVTVKQFKDRFLRCGRSLSARSLHGDATTLLLSPLSPLLISVIFAGSNTLSTSWTS